MLQVKSFSITDSDGMSVFLRDNRIAEGAHILVSDGTVCIPFEDGAPMSDTQKVVKIREDINKLMAQVEPMVHSQEVLQELQKDLEEHLATAMADFKSAPNNKKFKKLKEELEAAVDNNLSQFRHNEHEIRRIQVNIERYEKQVEVLKTGG